MTMATGPAGCITSAPARLSLSRFTGSAALHSAFLLLNSDQQVERLERGAAAAMSIMSSLKGEKWLQVLRNEKCMFISVECERRKMPESRSSSAAFLTSHSTSPLFHRRPGRPSPSFQLRFSAALLGRGRWVGGALMKCVYATIFCCFFLLPRHFHTALG